MSFDLHESHGTQTWKAPSRPTDDTKALFSQTGQQCSQWVNYTWCVFLLWFLQWADVLLQERTVLLKLQRVWFLHMGDFVFVLVSLAWSRRVPVRKMQCHMLVPIRITNKIWWQFLQACCLVTDNRIWSKPYSFLHLGHSWQARERRETRAARIWGVWHAARVNSTIAHC